MLGASSSQDMTSIRLQIEGISTMTSQSSHNQAGMKDEFIETLSRHQETLKDSVSEVASQVDERIGRVEELLKAQSERFQNSQPRQLAPYDKGAPYMRRSSSQASKKGGFVWSQIVHLQVAYLQNAGPQLQLTFLRRVPDSASCIDFALLGNIDGLKDLFARGLASPREVSSTRGYSVLRWALYGKQWNTCKFLVDVGADSDYRPISAHDNSPGNKAFDFILQWFLSREETELLNCLTTGSDRVEDQNFTVLHKIVTGLQFQSLDEALILYQDDVDAVDALGRTALTWAAARGDQAAVATLLLHGADPNALYVQWTGPVSYAAEQGRVVCVRLLLEAGASPDPIIHGNLKTGSPLNCAACNSTDFLVLKTLLDFGANVDASGVDGKTSLIHVLRTDNASFATLLLEYGANINTAEIISHTPLTTAITYNSHNVLQLLLDRWSEYSSCPRLQGPHLLETAAVFADLETLKILVATDHFRLKYDRDYILADCTNQVQDRYDVNDQIIAAFHDLVSVISDIPGMAENGLSRLEAGLLIYKDFPLVKNGMSGQSSDNCSEASFEDAVESLLK